MFIFRGWADNCLSTHMNMNANRFHSSFSALSILGAGMMVVMCTQCVQKSKDDASQTDSTAVTTPVAEPTVQLPEPSKPKNKFSNIIGWSDGQMPQAPAGFVVTEYAGNLKSPRWAYQLPNGDVLIVESNTETKGAKRVQEQVSGKIKSRSDDGLSANRITLLRDNNKDGKPDMRETFLSGLNQPFGIVLIKKDLYVANTDGVYKFPYNEGDTKITAKGQKILELPAGGYNNHWTRNLLTNADGSKIYISVGSGSNVAEHGMENEVRRANILQINPDGTGEKIFASGLRNPVGMDWEPRTKQLWTAVNERDELGDELVPDYLAHVKEGAFYGWPFAYWGAHEDPRMAGKNPELVKKTVVPDVDLGSHTASLGLAFYKGDKFPEAYRQGAFIGQHGSWNRSELVGYKVVFVPFKNGKPAGKPQDFLTGFIANPESGEVYGRPVGTFVLKDGSMLITDDGGGKVWRVAAK